VWYPVSDSQIKALGACGPEARLSRLPWGGLVAYSSRKAPDHSYFPPSTFSCSPFSLLHPLWREPQKLKAR
jgi:hypothetical protein